MNDYTSSISTVFTVIGILYGLWYSEIKNTINLPLSLQSDDNIEKIKKIKSQRNLKAYPLLIINLCMFFIYLPNAIQILKEFFNILQAKTNFTYNSTKTSFIFMLALSLLLSFSLCSDIRKLNDKLKPKEKKELS